MAHPPKPGPMRYITRMDYARTCGWWVRFYAGTKLLASKLFSDRKYGGDRKALQMAQDWRDSNESLWAAYKPGHPVFTRKNRRNVTNAVGVALRIQPERKGRARFSWAALWSEGGRQRTRSFGVVTHGYHRGYQLALDHRCKMLGVPTPNRRPPPLHHVLANRTY